MKYIDKTENGPEAFIAWRQLHHAKLEEMYIDKNCTGTQIWEYLDNHRADDFDTRILKNHLVDEQGYICCYCGTRILKNHNTTIEHLKPKGKDKYKKQTFEYHNLLASCMGGSKDIIHKMEPKQTIKEVAEKYGIDANHLEEVYVNKEFLERDEYDLENINEGDRVVILPSLGTSEQHCDTRKGQKEIDIYPTQSDCATYFSYAKETGEIKAASKSNEGLAEKTIAILGLNASPFLRRSRLKKINQALINIKQLLELAKTGQLTKMKERHRQLIEKAREKNEKKELAPWCFVTVSVLQRR